MKSVRDIITTYPDPDHSWANTKFPGLDYRNDFLYHITVLLLSVVVKIWKKLAILN